MPMFFPGPLAEMELSTTLSTAYTVPSGKMAVITEVRVVNNDSSTRNFELTLNGTAQVNVEQPMTPVPALERWKECRGLTLNDGDIIRGWGAVNSKMNLFIHGVEFDK